MTIRIRAAEPGEARALTEIAMRSKAHWGYSREFMEACRPALTVHGTCVDPTFVAFDDDHAAGFYLIRDGEVEMFFVDPPFIGTGVGRALWEHMVTHARSLGWTTLSILSDPQAEGFYSAMGAVRTGMEPSDVFGEARLLPRLRFDL